MTAPLLPDDGVGLRERCIECDCKLFAYVSRETGVCRDCMPEFDDEPIGLDLEDQLDALLK